MNYPTVRTTNTSADLRRRMELTSLLCIMHEIDLKMSNVFFYARVSSVWSVFFTSFVLLLFVGLLVDEGIPVQQFKTI